MDWPGAGVLSGVLHSNAAAQGMVARVATSAVQVVARPSRLIILHFSSGPCGVSQAGDRVFWPLLRDLGSLTESGTAQYKGLQTAGI